MYMHRVDDACLPLLAKVAYAQGLVEDHPFAAANSLRKAGLRSRWCFFFERRALWKALPMLGWCTPARTDSSGLQAPLSRCISRSLLLGIAVV